VETRHSLRAELNNLHLHRGGIRKEMSRKSSGPWRGGLGKEKEHGIKNKEKPKKVFANQAGRRGMMTK